MTTRWRYERMRPVHLAEAIKKRAIAWVPIGPLEWHGEAISFGCDPLYARAVCEKAWEKTGGVLFPPFYIGQETMFREGRVDGFYDRWALESTSKEHHPGSMFCRPITLELFMRDLLYFIEREGFRLCVLVSGHGGWEHVDILNLVEDLWKNRPLKLLYWKGGRKPMPGPLQFKGAGGHADFKEASMIGAVDPQLVDKARFGTAGRDRSINILKEHAGKIDYVKGRRRFEWEVKEIAACVNAGFKALPDRQLLTRSNKIHY